MISGNLSVGGGSDINWLVADLLGTPRMIIDKTGSLANVKRHDYQPFGEELVATHCLYTTGPGLHRRQRAAEVHLIRARRRDATRLRASQILQQPTGALYVGWAVQASASTGDPQTFNRYTYAMNATANFTDPSGMLSLSAVTSAMGQFARNFDPNGSGGCGGAFTGGGIEMTPPLP